MQIRWVTDPEDFAALRSDWERMPPAVASPFLSHAWFTAWWEAFGDDGAMRVATCWRDGALAAVLPLQFRAGVLTAMANEHTPRFGAVAVDPEARRRVLEAAMREQSSELHVPAIAVDDPIVEVFPTAARHARRGLHVVELDRSPVVATTGSYEDYHRSTKSRWGAPLERFRRKMIREHGAAFTTVAEPENLEGALDRGFAVEASGWKGRAGTAILSSAETTSFYRGLAQRFRAGGHLRISSLEFDRQMVAFDFTLLAGGVLHLLKTGYDEEFRRLAPGLVLRLSVIERCFELGLSAHHLGGAPDEWKEKFATHHLPHALYVSYRRRPPLVVRYGYRRWGRRARRAVRAFGAEGLPRRVRAGDGS